MMTIGLCMYDVILIKGEWLDIKWYRCLVCQRIHDSVKDTDRVWDVEFLVLECIRQTKKKSSLVNGTLPEENNIQRRTPNQLPASQVH